MVDSQGNVVKASGDKIELMAGMHYGEERSFLVWLASENDTVAIKGSQGETPDGIWPDVIGLSTREVALTGFRDTACVTTENVNWWINEIRLDGQQSYRPTLEETEKMAAGELVKIGCGWLVVEREGRKLTIMADVNDGKPRNFSIRLQSGDYFDEIKGTQDEAVIGHWPDMIGLSQDRIAFSAEGGTVSCSTNAKAYWWIPKIEIDGETHLTSSKEQMKCGEERTFNKSIGWLSVKRDGDMIYVTAQPNDTGKERSFNIVLQSGNWYSHIYGTQAG